ncbi:MAG: LacI family DNA-binding transcriptional regulator [Nocardioidaceae bacterium]
MAPSRQRSQPTLEEVAARAGVSRATASRVLRGESNVSDSAGKSVRAAAKAIAYTPNHAARSLVTGRSDSVAFLVDETEERMFADPFFLGMLRSAQVSMAAAGMQLVFTVISRPEDHSRFVSYAASGHVDGVLLMSLHGGDKLPLRLEELGVPTVLSGRPLSVRRRKLHYVDADNAGGAETATGYLLDSGRRRVATITGPQDMCAGQDRLTGYRSAFERRGERVEEALVVPAEFTFASGYAAATRLLTSEPGLDAIFAASDLAALGAMRAITQSGRKVFEDVAVIGFDDIADAAQANPALTTVRQPISDLGTTMSQRLLERIAGGSPPRQTILPVELIRRESA